MLKLSSKMFLRSCLLAHPGKVPNPGQTTLASTHSAGATLKYYCTTIPFSRDLVIPLSPMLHSTAQCLGEYLQVLLVGLLRGPLVLL